MFNGTITNLKNCITVSSMTTVATPHRKVTGTKTVKVSATTNGQIGKLRSACPVSYRGVRRLPVTVLKICGARNEVVIPTLNTETSVFSLTKMCN